MIKLLIKFWPVLMPITIYTIWYLLIRKKPTDENREQLAQQEARFWNWALTASIAIIFICIISIAFSAPSNINDTYVAPKYKDGKIIDGYMIAEPQESDE